MNTSTSTRLSNLYTEPSDDCPPTQRSRTEQKTLFLSRDGRVGFPYADVLNNIDLCMHFKTSQLGCYGLLVTGYDGGVALGSGRQRTITHATTLGYAQLVFNQSTRPVSICGTVEQFFLVPDCPESHTNRTIVKGELLGAPWDHFRDHYEP